jgi:hypothetical protein
MIADLVSDVDLPLGLIAIFARGSMLCPVKIPWISFPHVGSVWKTGNWGWTPRLRSGQMRE